jgi:hypothetical protein
VLVLVAFSISLFSCYSYLDEHFFHIMQAVINNTINPKEPNVKYIHILLVSEVKKLLLVLVTV